MRKILISILIALLLTLATFIAIQGFEIGPIKVLSYTGIKNESIKLDEKIQEASKKVEKDYKNAVSTVKQNAQKLEEKQKEYEDMTLANSEQDVMLANKISKYEVEKLWTKLGTHATTEGITLKIDIISTGQTIEIQKDSIKLYDLQFTANGTYISITDFISDIENDSELGFKIEEFTLIPTGAATDELKATFKCKNIGITEMSNATPISSPATTPASASTSETTNQTKNESTSTDTKN